MVARNELRIRWRRRGVNRTILDHEFGVTSASAADTESWAAALSSSY